MGVLRDRIASWVGGIEQANVDALETKATVALASNTTFLAIATPTAAQVSAQSKTLTRQVNALIRLQLLQFTDVSDT